MTPPRPTAACRCCRAGTAATSTTTAPTAPSPAGSPSPSSPNPNPGPCPPPAGSAIFLHGLTPHSSLPNRSGADRRTLIYAYRAGDAYPLYYGQVTAEDEAVHRPVRGGRARHARFGGPAPIVPEIDGTSSLYEIQAGRPGARPRPRH